MSFILVKDVNIRRLIQGDYASWSKFIDAFSAVIYTAIRKTLLRHCSDVNDSDIQDIVQSVFVRLIKEDYRLLKSYNPSKASLATWLTIVARSMAIDFLRRGSPQTVSIDEYNMDFAVAAEPTSLPINIPNELLSPRQKLILHLIFDREMAVPEIAELLKVNIQTVRSTKHKAIKKLRKFLIKKICKFVGMFC